MVQKWDDLKSRMYIGGGDDEGRDATYVREMASLSTPFNRMCCRIFLNDTMQERSWEEKPKHDNCGWKSKTWQQDGSPSNVQGEMGGELWFSRKPW